MLLVLLACSPDYGVVEQSRELYVAPLVDAGGVNVGDRVALQVPLYSLGRGTVDVTAITLVNDEGTAFVLEEGWQTADSDEDGVNDHLEVPEGDPDLTVFEELALSFRPDAEGYFRATVYLDTNDNEVLSIDPVEGIHDGEGVHVFHLRGIARYPRSTYGPKYIDFGQKPIGGYYYKDVAVTNTGSVILTIAAFTYSDGSSAAYTVGTQVPVYVLPGATEVIEVGYTPITGEKEKAEITVVTNSPDGDPVIVAIGNSCEESVDTSWDADGDGFFECGGDCDDHDANAHPDAQELENGRDDDCDGKKDEGTDSVSKDNDGDGVSENDGDCNDQDAATVPGAEEDSANNIDDDCDGLVDEGGSRYDDDGDGYAEREGDCNDRREDIHPTSDEEQDALDNDCDDNIDEGTWDFDDDQDGVTETDGDCDDYDSWTFPSAQEDCDGVDNDCDQSVDEGDGEGGGACSYLAVDDGEEQAEAEGCATTGARGVGGAVVGLALVGLAFRRRAG